MSHITTLAELAALQGDIDLQLKKPLEIETYNEVTYMMYLLSRADTAIAASRRALEARKVPFDAEPFRALEMALAACMSVIMPLPLAHATARDRGVTTK